MASNFVKIPEDVHGNLNFLYFVSKTKWTCASCYVNHREPIVIVIGCTLFVCNGGVINHQEHVICRGEGSGWKFQGWKLSVSAHTLAACCKWTLGNLRKRILVATGLIGRSSWKRIFVWGLWRSCGPLRSHTHAWSWAIRSKIATGWPWDLCVRVWHFRLLRSGIRVAGWRNMVTGWGFMVYGVCINI